MRILRGLASVLRGLGLAGILTVGAMVPAAAQTAPDPLGFTWDEQESGWTGVWTRRPGGNTFDATWTAGNQPPVRAALEMTLVGNRVTIVRIQAPGQASAGQRCDYIGFMDPAGVVSGTYSCEWANGSFPWTARVRQVTAPPPPPPPPPRATAGAFGDGLGMIWDEQETGWTGEWTRRAGGNTFDAVWTSAGQAPVRAVLEMTLVGNRVTIVRIMSPGQPMAGQRCDYLGYIDATGGVSGTFSCAWSAGQMAWTARLRPVQGSAGAGAGGGGGGGGGGRVVPGGPVGPAGWGVWAYLNLPPWDWRDPCAVQYLARTLAGNRYDDNPLYRRVRTRATQYEADLDINQFSLFFMDQPDGVVKFRSCDPERAATAATAAGGGAAGPLPGNLGRIWRVQEGPHTGTWTRRGDSTVFDGVWSEGTRTGLTISVSGGRVTIQRADGCFYEGEVQQGGSSVTGTMGCPQYGSSRADWSATVEP